MAIEGSSETLVTTFEFTRCLVQCLYHIWNQWVTSAVISLSRPGTTVSHCYRLAGCRFINEVNLLKLHGNSLKLLLTVALCYTRFFNGVCDYKYVDILVRLNFLTLHLRRRHLDALLLIDVFKGKISCSSVFDAVSLRIPTRSIRDYSTFTVQSNFKVSSSARCISAVNAVCRSIDI
jgi:hypothetical protein